MKTHSENQNDFSFFSVFNFDLLFIVLVRLIVIWQKVSNQNDFYVGMFNCFTQINPILPFCLRFISLLLHLIYVLNLNGKRG